MKLLTELKNILKLNISDRDKEWLIKERVDEVLHGIKEGIHPDKRIPYEMAKERIIVLGTIDQYAWYVAKHPQSLAVMASCQIPLAERGYESALLQLLPFTYGEVEHLRGYRYINISKLGKNLFKWIKKIRKGTTCKYSSATPAVRRGKRRTRGR